MTFLTITLDDGVGEETTHELPARYEVCPRCEGHGTHLTPSMGNHAYSQEEFSETFSEPEDREEYFRRGGRYDVTCEECQGRRVVLVVDEESCEHSPNLKPIFEAWRKQEDDRATFEREWRREQEMEARMLGG